MDHELLHILGRNYMSMLLASQLNWIATTETLNGLQLLQLYARSVHSCVVVHMVT